MYSACHDATGTGWKKQGIVLNRDWSLWGRNHHSLHVDTVSSMVSDASLRLLIIPSEKCNYCHQGLCDEICKENFSGLYMKNIQPLAVCWLETQFSPYGLTCSSFFRVLRPMIRRALWKPYLFFWCVEHTDGLIQWSIRIQPGMYSIHPLE